MEFILNNPGLSVSLVVIATLVVTIAILMITRPEEITAESCAQRFPVDEEDKLTLENCKDEFSVSSLVSKDEALQAYPITIDDVKDAFDKPTIRSIHPYNQQETRDLFPLTQEECDTAFPLPPESVCVPPFIAATGSPQHIIPQNQVISVINSPDGWVFKETFRIKTNEGVTFDDFLTPKDVVVLPGTNFKISFSAQSSNVGLSLDVVMNTQDNKQVRSQMLPGQNQFSKTYQLKPQNGFLNDLTGTSTFGVAVPQGANPTGPLTFDTTLVEHTDFSWCSL